MQVALGTILREVRSRRAAQPDSLSRMTGPPSTRVFHPGPEPLTPHTPARHLTGGVQIGH